MTDSSLRRRAPGMSAGERRQMVVQAALPLVAEYGAAVTTAQIAREAGIGEATIFRVFPDKDAVIEACVGAALDPTAVLTQLEAIDLKQPLEDRLLRAADVLEAYIGRMGTVVASLHSSGWTALHGRGHPDETFRQAEHALHRERARSAIRAAIAGLLGPDHDRLRLPADVLADAYLRLLFGRTFRERRRAEPRHHRQLIDLFLNGALGGGSEPGRGHR